MENGYRTSQPISPLLRATLPSIADVIFVALLLTLVFTSLSTRLLGDAGIGWHIRMGQLILATHHIPRLDPFSSTMAGEPWFAWEWLYDVIVGELDSAIGLNGVVWFSSVVIAAVFAGTFHWIARRGTNVFLSVVLVLLAVSASMIHLLARPHVVSWLFALNWFVILDISERNSLSVLAAQRTRGLWALPILMVIWVNMHGGFVIGFVLLAVYWLSACWTMWRTKPGRIEDALVRIAAQRRTWELLWVGVLCAAASLMNPYGWGLHRHVFSYLSNRFLMNHIQEFQSPDFHGWAPRCFLALVLTVVVALALRARKLRASELLIVLFSIYSGLYSARNLPVASVLLAVIAGPLLCAGSSAGFLDRMSRTQSSLRGHLWPVIAVVFVFAVAARGGHVGSAQLMDAHFDPKRMPIAGVDYIEQHGLRGPVLSTDFWGGYLIYRLYPREQVVVDDRHDLYGEAFFKSYLKMYRGEKDWQEFLQHESGCLLFPRNSAITNLLFENQSWKPLYEDNVAVVFVRSTSQ
jgi:hypothetical protein